MRFTRPIQTTVTTRHHWHSASWKLTLFM